MATYVFCPCRRRELDKTFFTECDCPRCEDGTEFGTNYGGILDTQYPGHVFVPKDPRYNMAAGTIQFFLLYSVKIEKR
jgi:hypothetical protein